VQQCFIVFVSCAEVVSQTTIVSIGSVVYFYSQVIRNHLVYVHTCS